MVSPQLGHAFVTDPPSEPTEPVMSGTLMRLLATAMTTSCECSNRASSRSLVERGLCEGRLLNDLPLCVCAVAELESALREIERHDNLRLIAQYEAVVRRFHSLLNIQNVLRD